MKVLQRPRGPGIPRGEFKNLTVRPRGTKCNLTVRILQVTMRYLLVLSWGSSWSPWGTSWSHREVPLSHNKNPPGECKLLHIPYHEVTSWSHGEVSHGHHEVPLVLTVRFILVTTRNLLVNVKFGPSDQLSLNKLFDSIIPSMRTSKSPKRPPGDPKMAYGVWVQS